jgi:filamentous hemagglutinin
MDSTKPVHRSQRVISWLIISLLVWQPVAPALAAAITPNGQTTMDKAANGVPVVNIATPNASGISHNQFQDYNVGKEGLILNNATGQLTQTQLGGLIQNNPNLKAGKEARGIVNEVVGASRSQLQGYTEVGGKAANVIVANPYGITCNGCGFINTPNATLTTGKPQFDANGNLAALDVTQGSITVEGQGLDASGSDALSLISRATEVNAAIHAKDLTVTVGANRVDANGKATAITSQSAAPTVAVDTGALGGMYANRIHLVSSDKGVGVNLGNLTARQGDITLDASGKLVVKNSVASGSLNARGDGVSLTGEHKAGGAATLTSTQDLALKDATLAADGAVSLNSNGTLSATNSSLTSGKGLTMSASQIGLDGTSRADAAGDVRLSGGDITNQGQVNTSGSLALSASTLDNSGKLAAKGRVDAQASRLDNSGNIQGNGVTVHAGTAQNSGALQSSDALTLTGDALSQSGTLSAGGDMTLSLTGALENGGQGKTFSDGILQIDAGTWTQNGTLSGQQGLTVNAGNLYGGEGSLTSSLGEIHLNATQHAGFDGRVSATGNLTVTADDVATGTRAQLQSSDTLNLQANSATLNGTQAAKNALTVTAKTLSHGGKSSADNITLNAPQTLTNSGTMQADALTLSGNHITNSGLLQGTNTFGLHTDRLDNLAGGTLYSVHDLTFDIPELNNSGLITTDSHLRLGGRSLMNAGEINGVTFDAGYQSVDNRSTGRLLADEGLAFTADSITNAGLLGAKQLSVTANSLVNQGSVQGNDALTLTTAETTNSDTLRSGGTLTLNGQTLDNSGLISGTDVALNSNEINNDGLLVGRNTLTLDAKKMLMGRMAMAMPQLTLINGTQGQLLTQGTLDVTAGSLINSGRLQSGSDTTLTLAGNLTNNASGDIVSGRGLAVTTPSMLNYGLIQGSGETRLDATTVAQNDGKVLSDGRLTLATAEYTGTGLLQATNLILNAVSNTGSGKLVADQMTLTGDTFTNQGTTQAGELALNYRQITNNGTLLGTSKLTVNATQLDQSASGKLFSGGDLFVGASGLNALGQMVALGNLTLQLANAFTAQTALAAGQTLSITSDGAIDNQSVMQGQAVNLAAGGQLTNNGQITTGSGSSTLSGSQVVLNAGSSIQGGGDVTLASRGNITANGFVGSLGNLTLSAPGSLINTAMLYAANNMSLYANSITNQRGNILAGNNLLMQRDAAGNANSNITNTSGTIETQRGDISIKTGRLLNTREGLSVQQNVIQNSAITPASLITVKAEDLPEYGVLVKHWEKTTGGSEGPNGSGKTTESYTRYIYVPGANYTTRDIIASQTQITVNSTGGPASIRSGRNIIGNINALDNQASNIYANGNITLSGGSLNNASYQAGLSTNSYHYEFLMDPSLTYDSSAIRTPPTIQGSGDDRTLVYDTGTNSTRDSYRYEYHGYSWSDNNYDYYEGDYSTTKDKLIKYQLVGQNSVLQNGELYRSIIQAGGSVTANFSNNISNTNTTANAGGVSSTITAPSLNTLSNQSIGGSVEKETLAGSVPENAAQWQDQLQGALQQISGGSATAELGHYTGKTVDTSAYPLPSGNSGYFVVTDNPKSPYLITINPKLDGLGQLDPALFGDLNKLLGINPSAAPRETNTAYTNEKQFLGSSYMLSRINLNPDYDYRFLGDAAFDTRYVSNVILNQTGNRYLNGVGSDLAQMQYLMDNAASAQQSLGLQFGVSLTADQIAALNHSILWWESTTINGETVMVPKVYLSPNDVTVNNGSVIAGNNVNLNSGSITNGSSTLLAKNDLSVDSAGQINNTGDALIKAGGNLSLSANGDINNLSSTISGKTVQLESLDGSINNITLADQYSLNAKDKYGSVNIKGTTLGSTASISAQDSLSLEAWNDINLVGAKLASGGDMALDAWGDVNVKAIQVNDSYSQSGFNGKKATSNVNTTWQGSGISAGGNLSVQAANDLTIAASDISAGKDAALTAGNNLNLNAEQTEQSSRKGKSETHATGQDRTTVSAGGDLKLAAGQDVTSQAAALAADKKVTIQAGRDVNLQAEATTQGDSYKSSKKTVINETVRQQGTEIASGTDTVIVAGRDVNTQAAQVTAQGDIGVTAGRDVNLNTATESDYAYKEKTVTSGGFLSKSTTHTVSEQSATHEAGTLLSGDNVTVKAGNDLLVKGSSVVGDGDVALSAGHNVDITAATNTDSNWQLKEKKKSGLMGSGGIGFTIGSSKSKQELKEKGTTQSQSVSTVGSNGGDVTITAGNQLHVGGSDLIAKNDLALTGDSVVIDPGHDKRTTDQKFEQKSSGLTVALTGAVVDAVNSAVTTAQAASKQSDSRLAALQATKSVLSGYQAVQGKEMADTTGEPNSGIRVSISLTTQKSKSEQHQKSDQVSGSTLNAGNDLSITATGKNHEANSGDIVVAGSSMKAGGDASLDAARDIVLAGAANTQKTTGSNSSSGGGVGVSFGVGQGGAGLSVFANVNAAKGNEKGDGTNWTETTLDSGGKVSLHSGQDATLTGAQVSGNQVTADIGRNLTVTSLQDSNNYDSKQSSVSAGGSFTFGSMTGSGYINFSQDKMHSTFDSVAEQSGIFAGAGGFDVTVGSHTQLNGGAIGSTATADKNSLDTGTLGYSNITNKADYKVSHSGGGFSSSATMGAQAALSAASTLMSSVGSSGHAKGTTEAAVSEGTITVRDTANQQQDVSGLQRDVSQANDAISPIFNKEKEQNRLQAVQMISDIGNQVADIVRTQSDLDALKEVMSQGHISLEGLPEKERLDKLAELRSSKPYKELTEKFGTGSDIQRAITAATAAVSGLAGGNLNAALAGAAAPYIASEIGKNITENNTMAGIMAHAVVNAVLAKAQGQDALVGAAGAVVGETTGILLAKQVYNKDPSELDETEKQTIAALSTLASGLAGGLIGDSTETATAAANAGKTTVENNSLAGDKARESVKESKEWWKKEIRDKLGEGATSAIANSIINAVADTGDSALGGTDYVLDGAMALASCAVADNYCNKALSDLAGKNQAAADAIIGLMKSETWATVAIVLKGAVDGNQASLEATGGILASILSPGKKMPEFSTLLGKTERLVKNADGIYEVTINVTPLEGHNRLNTPDLGGNGKLKPAEAASAAQLEPTLGTMERFTPSSEAKSGTSPDFVITSGPNKGKTVDAMYTTDRLSQKEIDGLNKFYEKNMSSGSGRDVIQDHLQKADFVPVDFRVLTPLNQKIFMDYIKTLPEKQQAKVIIMR